MDFSANYCQGKVSKLNEKFNVKIIKRMTKSQNYCRRNVRQIDTVITTINMASVPKILTSLRNFSRRKRGSEYEREKTIQSEQSLHWPKFCLFIAIFTNFRIELSNWIDIVFEKERRKYFSMKREEEINN